MISITSPSASTDSDLKQCSNQISHQNATGWWNLWIPPIFFQAQSLIIIMPHVDGIDGCLQSIFFGTNLQSWLRLSAQEDTFDCLPLWKNGSWEIKSNTVPYMIYNIMTPISDVMQASSYPVGNGGAAQGPEVGRDNLRPTGMLNMFLYISVSVTCGASSQPDWSRYIHIFSAFAANAANWGSWLLRQK